MYVVLVLYPLFLSDFIKIEFSQHSFEKYSNVKSHENPSNGSRVVLCGQTDRHYESYSRFSNISNAPIKEERSFVVLTA